MNQLNFDKYCFLRLYSVDFDIALKTLSEIRRYKRPMTQHALLRDVIVAYARPFSGNQGLDGSGQKNALSKQEHVPESMLSLHSPLIKLRNEQFAHTDLKWYRPAVAKWKTDSGPIFPMAFRRPDYEQWIPRLNEIKQLMDAVSKSVDTKIAELECEFR